MNNNNNNNYNTTTTINNPLYFTYCSLPIIFQTDENTFAYLKCLNWILQIWTIMAVAYKIKHKSSCKYCLGINNRLSARIDLT